MNTILITGTAKSKAELGALDEIRHSVIYSVNIWGAKEGEPLQFVTSYSNELDGYNSLWTRAKLIAKAYFDSPKFDDGGYTQFLDHLIMI